MQVCCCHVATAEFLFRKLKIFPTKAISRQTMKKWDKNAGKQLFFVYLVLKFKNYGAVPLSHYCGWTVAE